MVVGQLGLAVQLGMAVEVDAHAAAVGAVVEVDRQVLDRAGGQRVRGGGVPGELQVVVEPHDVDHRPEQPPAHLAAEVLVAVPLVRQQPPDLPVDLRDQLAERHLRRYGQAQREHVGEHPGGTAGGRRGPGGDRQPQDHLPGAAEPCDEGRGGGDHQPRDGRAVRERRLGERGGVLVPHRRAPPVETRGGHGTGRRRTGGRGTGRRGTGRRGTGGRRTRRQGRHGGQVAEHGQPVAAVGLVAGGGAVGGVLLQQGRERAEVSRLRVAPVGQRGVDLGQALGDHRPAVAVHDHVMAAQVPEVAVVGDAQQRGGDQPLRGEGRLQLGPHPLQRGPLVPRVEEGALQLPLLDDLPFPRSGALPVLDDPQVHGLGLARRPPDRRGEDLRLHRARYLDVLGDVDRVPGSQSLGTPNSTLRCGQWQK